MENAPIALFVYKRPEHTRKTIESLLRNKKFFESQFYVFCDGARAPSDFDDVQRTRDIVRSFKIQNIFLVEQQKNIGLANSIVSGVSRLCEEYGKVIVLEDDLIVSTHFLDFMNQALSIYEECDNVMQIAGYMFPVQPEFSMDAFFLPVSTSWGWATWQRAWKHFDPKYSGYTHLKKSRKLAREFNLDNSYPYTNMLKRHAKGEVDSWAICWYLTTFMRNALTLYPSKSLVKNIGFDGSGTHCKSKDVDELQLSDFQVTNFPECVVSSEVFDSLKKFHRKQNNFLTKVLNFVW